jgi:peptide deformylase
MGLNLITIDFDQKDDINLFLRKESLPVNEIDNTVLNLIDQMINVVQSIKYATGLSAIQLGVPLKIFIVNFTKEKGKDLVCINPSIVSISGRIKYRSEGCLSLPNYKGIIGRREKIHFKAMDTTGKTFEYKASGYHSAVIQHEFDHLDGKLFWDYLKENEHLVKI